MTKMEVMIIADYSEIPLFDIKTLCELCSCTTETVILFMQYELIKPVTKSKSGELLFDSQMLAKLKMALRLQRDFDLNISGLALVMDLISERDALLNRNALLERHLFG